MSEKTQQLLDKLQARFADALMSSSLEHNEVTIEVGSAGYVDVCLALRDEQDFAFEQLIDLCGVDYLQYGRAEWTTNQSSNTGFSRGVENTTAGRLSFGDELDVDDNAPRRYAVVLHLLSYKNNHRLRVRTYAEDTSFPLVPSVVDIWNSADWYEREAFDLLGILFDGHTDLRRILTDYGFVGHPFRKDFPLVGHVEMRYDPEKGRVVYEPVTIEPRVLVPKVIRDDNRYIAGAKENLGES
jgi:NADH-quinone oxidoreductase subunit C